MYNKTVYTLLYDFGIDPRTPMKWERWFLPNQQRMYRFAHKRDNSCIYVKCEKLDPPEE